jgi:hypothetical protein
MADSGWRIGWRADAAEKGRPTKPVVMLTIPKRISSSLLWYGGEPCCEPVELPAGAARGAGRDCVALLTLKSSEWFKGRRCS